MHRDPSVKVDCVAKRTQRLLNQYLQGKSFHQLRDDHFTDCSEWHDHHQNDKSPVVSFALARNI